MVLTFQSVYEISWCYHSNETSWTACHMVLFVYKTFTKNNFNNNILLYTSGFEMNLKVLPAMKMYTLKSHILLTSGCQTQHHAEMSRSSVS